MDSPAALLQAAIAEGALELVDAPGSHHCEGGTHSRLADGRALCWRPELHANTIGYAVDAEIAAQPLPPALLARLGAPRDGEPVTFWEAWTRAEVCAKLFDVPILVWITRHGLPASSPVRRGPETVHYATAGVGDLVVTYGLRT